MRDRLVAAGSVVVLLLSACALVEAVQVRVASTGSAVPSTAVAGPEPTADLHSSAGPGRVGTSARRSGVGASAEPATTEPASAAPRRRDWRMVLATLDRRRARAYAAADTGRLADVYVAGSGVLRRDRAVLERYTRRGLRVVGLRMRLAGVTPQRVAGDRVVLRVRERLAGGAVVGARTRRPLPSDEAVDSRLVTLRRVAGAGWRIAAVRAAAR